MKTKISIFITSIALLFGATAAFAQGTQAYFKKDGVTVFQTPISNIDSIVFKQTAVEEGVVINGVRWATRNVDAPGTFVQNPEDYGEYYQFNKGTTDFLGYDYYNNSVFANSDSWLPANDPSPSGWRAPTSDEIQKLYDPNYVTYEWINDNGLTGKKFTDKATGKSIFLPAAGYRYYYDGGGLYGTGDYGYYWSSTVYDANDAYVLNFGLGGGGLGGDVRGDGFSVRPVEDICQSFDKPQGVVINGVRWATRNVGAPGTFASSPCDYGEYYQFNKGTTDFLLYDDYWNSVYANSDSWLPANDPSPSGWRIPTSDEIQKLLDPNYVTYEWIDNNGLTGGEFTDKATGNSIFLPAAGFLGFDGALRYAGYNSDYWSSTVNHADNDAYGLLNSGDTHWLDYYDRSFGFSVRPVAE